MKELMEKAKNLLEQDESFVMATIVAHAGSTPREAGSRMIVRENGEFFGTIGGGLVEAIVQKKAKEIFLKYKDVSKEEIRKLVLNYLSNIAKQNAEMLREKDKC